MKRKLVQQGTSTLMISLPSKWIKDNGLNKGDEIFLNEEDNNLFISHNDREQAKKHGEISLKNEDESLIRTLITTLYRKGYDSVKVNFTTQEQVSILNSTLNSQLMGFEIIKKEKDHLIIENITEPSYEQFDIILRKIFYNISHLIEITKNRINNSKKDEEYEEVEERIKKYDNFCRRIITKKKMKDSPIYWSFLTLLIDAQREIYYLNKYLDKEKGKLKEIKTIDNLKEVYSCLEESFLKNSIEKIEKLHLIEDGLKFEKIKCLDAKSYNINHYIISAIRLFYLASSPLIGLLFSSSNSK